MKLGEEARTWSINFGTPAQMQSAAAGRSQLVGLLLHGSHLLLQPVHGLVHQVGVAPRHRGGRYDEQLILGLPAILLPLPATCTRPAVVCSLQLGPSY